MICLILYFFACFLLYVFWTVSKFFWVRAGKTHIKPDYRCHRGTKHKFDIIWDFILKPVVCCIPLVNVALLVYVFGTSFGEAIFGCIDALENQLDKLIKSGGKNDSD